MNEILSVLRFGRFSGRGGQQKPSARRVSGFALAASVLIATPVPTIGGFFGARASLVWNFDRPSAVAGTDGYVFVANRSSNSVTMIKASTGSYVRTLSGSSYDFNEPNAMLADGQDVFAANFDGNSITEMSSTAGKVVRVIRSPEYRFRRPDAMAVWGVNVVVANYTGDSLTIFNAASGKFVRLLANGGRAPYPYDAPDGLAVKYQKVFVSNADGFRGSNLVEVNPANGAVVRSYSGAPYSAAIALDGARGFVASNQPEAGAGAVVVFRAALGGPWRVLNQPSYGFEHPDAMAVADGLVFVVNGSSTSSSPGGSVTEVNTNGTLVNRQYGSGYMFEAPDAIAAEGADMFVANGSSNTLTEFVTTTGALVRVIGSG
ncbi:MAG TPA: hypothetical protein VGP46_06855 [Acidimicrobiales bacterium]|nr:hypothetical protein [Acidimicrobiales bacterium]